ncbi:MAG: Asp-tRNA(Asn)/Glu-tRNA(Gln) amidotransferase subunit GatC [SAR202 cluster bacterium]|nr:Asp-tRNA(Asn)/Glu-tRNA(Gln) amidotransferase subunit GatC [SAR202 cluster bacterium]
MRLTSDEVKHVAHLARLGMSDDETELMRDQLSNILEQFKSLEQVDTKNIEPTGHSANLQSVMRDDTVEPSRPKKEILKNAPQVEDEFIRIRAVLE